MLQCIKTLIMNSTVLGTVQTQNKHTVTSHILVIYIRKKKKKRKQDND